MKRFNYFVMTKIQLSSSLLDKLKSIYFQIQSDALYLKRYTIQCY